MQCNNPTTVVTFSSIRTLNTCRFSHHPCITEHVRKKASDSLAGKEHPKAYQLEKFKALSRSSSISVSFDGRIPSRGSTQKVILCVLTAEDHRPRMDTTHMIVNILIEQMTHRVGQRITRRISERCWDSSIPILSKDF